MPPVQNLRVRKHSTNPDETGVYRFHAAPGRVLVMVSAPLGYQDIGEVRRYVAVAEGESVTVDFQFSKGMESVVQTMTETGEPVSDAWVSKEWAMDNRIGGRSNGEGKYTVRGLRPGQRLHLTADQRELGLSGTAEVEVEPGESIKIQMHQYGKIKVSGRVVDEKGDPMPSVPISMSRWERQRKFLVATNVGVTDSDGRFQAVGLIDWREVHNSCECEPRGVLWYDNWTVYRNGRDGRSCESCRQKIAAGPGCKATSVECLHG